MDTQISSFGTGEVAVKARCGTAIKPTHPNNPKNIDLTSDSSAAIDDDVMSSIIQDDATSTENSAERKLAASASQEVSGSDSQSFSMKIDGEKNSESSLDGRSNTLGNSQAFVTGKDHDEKAKDDMGEERLMSEAMHGLIGALRFVQKSEEALLAAKEADAHSFFKVYQKSGDELTRCLDADWKENHFMGKEIDGDKESKVLMITSYSLSTLRAPGEFKEYTSRQPQAYLRFCPASCIKEPDVPLHKRYALRESLRAFLATNPDGFSKYAGLGDFLARMENEDLPPSSVGMDEDGRRSFLLMYSKYAVHKDLSKSYASLHERHSNDDRNDSELMMALGHTRFAFNKKKEKNKVFYLFNGPLIEIPVKSNMLEDGIIEVVADEHAKVRLNLDFVSAVEASGMGNNFVFKKLQEMTKESKPDTLTPWDSNSYLAFCERAKILCANGVLKSCSDEDVHQRPNYPKSMAITEAWCLYSATKSKSIFSNDSECLIEAIGSGKLPVTPIFSSLIHGGTNVKHCVLSQADTTLVSPLPATKSQESIFQKLFMDGMPLVVADGPPGTGKTQTSVNCAIIALINDRQPLVTSNNAKALVSFKEKLPVALRELCIDISSFDEGSTADLRRALEDMRGKLAGIKDSIEGYEEEVKTCQEAIEHKKECLSNYDEYIELAGEAKRVLLQHHDVQHLLKLILRQEGSTPYIIKSILTVPKIMDFFEEVESSVGAIGGSPRKALSFEFFGKLSFDLLAFVSWKAGKSSDVNSGKTLGDIDSALSQLKVNGKHPDTQEDWCHVWKALRHKKWEADLEAANIDPGCLEEELLVDGNLKFGKALNEVFQKLTPAQCDIILKPIEDCNENKMSRDQRRDIMTEIQSLESQYVVAMVMLKLGSSLSHGDLSTLSELAQLASKGINPKATEGKAKRRHDAFVTTFKNAIKVIPFPVMSAKQVSRYCPADHMFGLGIIDEASQSNCTAINILARCSQMVVVGDDKQVSPDGSFVKEELVDYLDKRKPDFPGARHLLPGSSFFDLCKVAFPCSHVFLQDHFRCRPEIIALSNKYIYGGQLNPLRLPSTEAALVDVRVAGTRDKKRKTNQVEADAIAAFIYDKIKGGADKGMSPRPIFAISMAGAEQVKLLKTCIEAKIDSLRTDPNYGPDIVDAHNIFVGTASQCQGGERRLVVLSAVYDSRSVYAPSNDDAQLQEERNWNVATSRAQDELVLFRSYDMKDIKNQNDIKRKYLSGFINAKKHYAQTLVKESSQTSAVAQSEKTPGAMANVASAKDAVLPRKKSAGVETRSQPWSVRVRSGIEAIFTGLMEANGLVVTHVEGKFWKNALYVGNKENADVRALVYIATGDEDKRKRKTLLDQQSSLERAGRACFQVDGISLLFNTQSVEDGVLEFLATAGIPILGNSKVPASLQTYASSSDLNTASSSGSTKRSCSSSPTNKGVLKRLRKSDDDENEMQQED